jgi:hypothetical protein
MRYMKRKYGVILFDSTEIIVRVYVVAKAEWRLEYYHNMQFPKSTTSLTITEMLAEFFLSEQAQDIAEWKISSRGFSLSLIKDVAKATGTDIEGLTMLREQELLCKGMFTELW